MTERLEDRLRDALDLLTADPPLTKATAPPRPRRRPSRPRRLPALVAAAAVIAAGLVLVDRIADGGDGALRQVTGPATTTVPAEPATAPPPPTTRRATYPDAPTIAASPVGRASIAFGYGEDGRWSWFVADGADGSIRVAADLLTGRSFESRTAALSPDGRRLAYSIVVPPDADGPPVTPQVVVVDLTTGRETRFAADAHLGPGAWSPDGRRMAWIDGGRTLVLADADGRPGAAVPVGTGRARVAWSPAGNELVVSGCPEGVPPAIACIPTIVNATTLAVRAHPLPMSGGVVWSPDGRSLVDLYRTEVFLVAADASGSRQVPVVDSLYPVDSPFSPDGSLMLLRPERSGPRTPYAGAASLSGRPVAEVADEQQVPTVVGWKGDGALLVAREEPGAIVLYEVPLDGAARRRLLSVGIRSEDFSARSWVVAAWFSRG